MNKEVVIIGGGLSGLVLAYLLNKEKIHATIIEASSRLGGRISTLQGPLGTPLELGATWFSDQHVHLKALVDELELQRFHQYTRGITIFQTKSFEPVQHFEIPESAEPSYRINGGTEMLIRTLEAKVSNTQIYREMKVVAVDEREDGILVSSADGEKIMADVVVSCIPPQLLSAQIRITPQLPEAVSVLLPDVQTWMAGAVKFVIEYKEPFWRKKGFSGMLFSHAGMITEMYDHTNAEEDRFGFTGFLNGGVAGYAEEVRKEYVLNQLAALMGEAVRDFSLYEDKVWKDDNLVVGSPVFQRPHQHNGHALLQAPYLRGRFYFCGTETAVAHAGYMEGAVIAAKAVAERITEGASK